MRHGNVYSAFFSWRHIKSLSHLGFPFLQLSISIASLLSPWPLSIVSSLSISFSIPSISPQICGKSVNLNPYTFLSLTRTINFLRAFCSGVDLTTVESIFKVTSRISSPIPSVSSTPALDPLSSSLTGTSSQQVLSLSSLFINTLRFFFFAGLFSYFLFESSFLLHRISCHLLGV